MDDHIYTIGELSKLSGVSVRKIRFYSDKALLPPTARAENGYRMYSSIDLERLNLILTLRRAGASLGDIQRILSRQLAISDVLKLRLQTLEAEITSKRLVAAALRAALRMADPTADDLRRLWTVTQLSQSEFRSAIERFFDQAAEGTEIDPAWRKQMIEAAVPELPDDPTTEQIDAWTELATIISDKEYVKQVRADMAKMWNGYLDAAAYAKASNEILAEVKTAIGEGIEPHSDKAKAVAQKWLEQSATAMKRKPDQDFLGWHIQQYRKYYSRSMRYQELMHILQGNDAPNSIAAEWRWLTEAMEHHL